MKKILIVEGNTKEDNQSLIDFGIETHAESLKNTILNYTNRLEFDVINPSSENIDDTVNSIDKYSGLIWGGGSMHVYDDLPEIRKQLDLMKICFKKIKNIFALCWGMQVAVVAAGGQVKKCSKGTNIGISNDIELTDLGILHPLYKGKPKKFNTPAYNYDEVVKLPEKTNHLSFNNVNKIQGINFKVGNCDICGIQYHPEITYKKMINLINYREEHLLSNKHLFKNKEDLDNHINKIKSVDESTDPQIRMKEVENWLSYSSLLS